MTPIKESRIWSRAGKLPSASISTESNLSGKIILLFDGVASSDDLKTSISRVKFLTEKSISDDMVVIDCKDLLSRYNESVILKSSIIPDCLNFESLKRKYWEFSPSKNSVNCSLEFK